jgi:acyl-CoA synthetase (AMP-forming)/AMP-acid ligase II
LPNGEIDLIGGADNQIKLRGYRIELEEVEALFDSHPGISKSVARVVDIGGGEQSLVAYVVPRDRRLIQESAWRAHALRSLPAYMVPTAFMIVESFALTPNGKVDRKALPPFHLTTPADSERGSELRPNDMEQTVLLLEKGPWPAHARCGP